MNRIDHFQRLLAFETWANERAIRAAEPIYESDERTRVLLSHILNAHAVWLSRVLKRESRHGIWQTHAHADLPAIDRRNVEEWRQLLATTSEAQLLRVVDYKDSSGNAWQTALGDIMQHVLNHSTYHRGQIAARLASQGHPVLPTDYIAFTRQA